MASNGLDFLLNLRANTSGFNQGIDGAKFAVNALAAALAAVGIGLGIKELAEAADSYANLSARVNIATKDTGNFTEAMAGIHRVALETNSNLEATAALFTRLNTIGKDMGMTQQQALDLTKTVTQAIQLGGGSAQASEAAVTQFIQAMQGGVLRGEEFNSIMENGYGLAEALAKGLGVTTGELRKMAENGELGAERVLKALESQKKSIEETYAQMPLTIGNALQKIATSWQILIGEMDQANRASATVAQWLSTLADNMVLLKPILDDIGEGFVWVGDQLKKQYDTSTIQALYDALEAAYDGIKSLISTIGDAWSSTYDILDAALSSIFGFTNAWRPAGEEVSGFQKVLDVLNVGLSILSDGFKAIGIVVNLFTGALFSVAAAYNQVKSVLTWGGVKEQAIANMNAMTEKANEYYKKASDGAMNFESSSIKALTNIGKTDEQRNQDRITDNEKTLTELKAQEEKHKADYKVISDERIKLNQQLVDARKSGDQSAIDAAIAGLAELDKKEKDYQAVSKKHADEKVKAAQDWADAQIEAATKGGNALDEQTRKTIAAKIEAQGLAVEFDKTGKATVKAMDNGTQAVESTGNATDKARKAASALGIDLDIALNRVSEKFEAGGKSVDDFSNGLEGLGATGEQAADLTYQAWQKWLETAESPAELDAAQAKLQEFGDKGVISTEQVEMGLVAIKRQAQELPADIDPVTAAFERLGIKTKDQLHLATQSAKADYNAIKESGQATTEGLQEAFKKYAQTAIAANGGVADSALESEARSAGLAIQTDATGKATVVSMAEAEAATKKAAQSAAKDGVDGYKKMGDAAEDAGAKAAQAAKDVAAEQSKATTDFLNSVAGAISSSANNYAQKIQDLGVEAGMAAKYAQDQYKQMWKEFGAMMFGGIVAQSKTAKEAMAEHIYYLELAKDREQRRDEAAQETLSSYQDIRDNAQRIAEAGYDANTSWQTLARQGLTGTQSIMQQIKEDAADVIKSAQDSALSFMGSVDSIRQEFLKATGQEKAALEMRYNQRRQQLTLEYEMLKVQITAAKITAQQAGLATDVLDKALSDATEGFKSAQEMLAELQKMELESLTVEAEVDTKVTKTVNENTNSSYLDPVAAKANALQPPDISVSVPSTANIESPSKTVRYEISLDGNTVELYGDASEESSLNAFMSQLEQLKKGM